MPMYGMGTRVSKSSWHDDSYWHIVDVRPKLKRSQSADALYEASDDDAAASGRGSSFRARVYGIKFWNGVPETGRVVTVRGSKKRVWRRLSPHDEAAKNQAALLKIASGMHERLSAMHAEEIQDGTETGA